ncbi:MAG: alpha/beta hydrolase, partial [Myxococcota bacterium]
IHPPSNCGGGAMSASILVVVRVVAAAFLFLLGLLAVFKAPFYILWKPAVAATAWGHLLALFALGIAALAPFDRSSHLATALALSAALLLVSPWIRAWVAAPAIPSAFSKAIAPAQGPALTWAGLLGPRSGTATLSHHTYRPQLDLDLYMHSDTEGPRPLIIAIHGGSWQGGDQTQLPAINHHLASLGYAVAAIRYRLAPASRYPDMHDDIEAAIVWLQHHAKDLGLDPDRVVLLGRSAGGHLALSAGYTSSNPAIRGVVALYPPTDMHWSWAHPGNPLVIDTHGTLRVLLGGAPDEAKDLYDAASPIQHVQPSTPPTLLLHGTRDELVFPIQSRRLAEQLKHHGVRHLAIELPWATHGFDANLGGPGGQIYVWALERFLAHVFNDA